MQTKRYHLRVWLLPVSCAFFVLFLCVTLAHGAEFSPLLQRGTDRNAMAFNSQGDVYFIGWAAGLERAFASQLPNDEANPPMDPLISMNAYNQIFEPVGRTILDINGVGIGFDSEGNVISFLEEVYRIDQGSEASRVRFVRYHPSSSSFDGLLLAAGEDFTAELGLAYGAPFEVDGRAHVPLQMVVTQVAGAETILFTLKDVPVIFQAPVAGGDVTTFYRFSEAGYPWGLTVMERQGQRSLIASHSNGNIYQVDLASPSASILVAKSALLGFFGESETHWNIDFVDLDYEPIGDRIYVTAIVPWHTPEIPRTLIAITPDGSQLEKVFDVAELTAELAGIRTPENGTVLQWNTVVVNPVAVAQGQASLFLGDHWSGLKMVRVDLSPPPTPAEQMLNILNYFDESVAAGTIYTNDSAIRFGVFRNAYRDILRSTIAFAYLVLDLQDRGYLEGPIGQYWSSYVCSFSIPYLLLYTDGVGRDYVAGPGVPQLHSMIEGVGESLGCGS